jgi:hypothetical protein
MLLQGGNSAVIWIDDCVVDMLLGGEAAEGGLLAELWTILPRLGIKHLGDHGGGGPGRARSMLKLDQCGSLRILEDLRRKDNMLSS